MWGKVFRSGRKGESGVILTSKKHIFSLKNCISNGVSHLKSITYFNNIDDFILELSLRILLHITEFF